MQRLRGVWICSCAVVTALLAGCASFPTQVLLDPARFENDAIRVEWAIGINFFRIKLTNLTDAQIDLDLANSALISVDGEARPLSVVTKKDGSMVPPRSYVVFGGDQGAVFGTDILGRFNAETEERYPMPGSLNSDDRVFLKGHTGETIRLYLTADVRGKKTIYDITYKISGVTRVGARAEAAPAQPAAQPVVQPPVQPAPKGKM